MADNVINGTDVLIFFSSYHAGTTPAWGIAGHATSFSLRKSMSTRDISNKGTGAQVNRAAGRLDVTGSMQGLSIHSDTYNYANFSAAWLARTPLLMLFGQETSSGSGSPDTTTSGGAHYHTSGLFLITNLSEEYPDKENATYTMDFELASDYKENDYLT